MLAARQARISPWTTPSASLPLVGLGLQAFWFSLMAHQLPLRFKAGLLPAGGYGDNPIGAPPRSLTLPAFVIAISILPFTIQSLRVAMVDSLEADYVAAARARGVPGRRVLFAYGVRDATRSRASSSSGSTWAGSSATR